MRYIQRPTEVDAHRIIKVEEIPSDNPMINTYRIVTAEDRAHTIAEMSWTPQPGDYWIHRSDGSSYFLPASSFESRFQPSQS